MKGNALRHLLLNSFLFLSVILFVQCSGDAQLQKALKGMAEAITKDCPIVYDQYTQLDNCEALPNKVLRYNYTVDFDKLDITKEELEARMKPYLLSGVKVASDMKVLRDNDVSFEYSYKGKDGKLICEFRITPDDYKSSNKSK